MSAECAHPSACDITGLDQVDQHFLCIDCGVGFTEPRPPVEIDWDTVDLVVTYDDTPVLTRFIDAARNLP